MPNKGKGHLRGFRESTSYVWLCEDLSKNKRRWYAVHLQRNLFGSDDLICRWGRIGFSGFQQSRLLELSPEATRTELARISRLRTSRGYRIVSPQLAA